MRRPRIQKAVFESKEQKSSVLLTTLICPHCSWIIDIDYKKALVHMEDHIEQNKITEYTEEDHTNLTGYKNNED